MKAKWSKTIDEAMKSVKIGTKEEAFLTEELEAAKRSIKLQEKAIEANKWLISLYEKRIKEIENES